MTNSPCRGRTLENCGSRGRAYTPAAASVKVSLRLIPEAPLAEKALTSTVLRLNFVHTQKRPR